MFNKKQKEIDRLNSRCVELAQQLRDSNLENKQLKEVRLIEVRNNTKILKQNNKKTELITRINELLNANKYNNEKVVLNKIKELVKDYHTKN